MRSLTQCYMLRRFLPLGSKSFVAFPRWGVQRWMQVGASAEFTDENYKTLVERSYGDGFIEAAVRVVMNPDWDWSVVLREALNRELDPVGALIMFYCMVLRDMEDPILMWSCIERMAEFYSSSFADAPLKVAPSLEDILKDFPGWPNFRSMLLSLPLQHRTRLALTSLASPPKAKEVPRIPTWSEKLPVDMEQWEEKQPRVMKTRYVNARAGAPLTSGAGFRLRSLVGLQLIEEAESSDSIAHLVEISSVFSRETPIFKGTLLLTCMDKVAKRIVEVGNLEDHVLNLSSFWCTCGMPKTPLYETRPFERQIFLGGVPSAYGSTTIPPSCTVLWNALSSLIPSLSLDGQVVLPHPWHPFQDIKDLPEDTEGFDVIKTIWRPRVGLRILTNFLIFSAHFSGSHWTGPIRLLAERVLNLLNTPEVRVPLAEAVRFLDAAYLNGHVDRSLVLRICDILAADASIMISDRNDEKTDDSKPVDVESILENLGGSVSDLNTLLSLLRVFGFPHPDLEAIGSQIKRHAGAPCEPSLSHLIAHP